MTATRNRKSSELPLDARLQEAAAKARADAKLLAPGREKEALLAKARQFEAQIGMNKFFR